MTHQLSGIAIIVALLTGLISSKALLITMLFMGAGIMLIESYLESQREV